MPPYGKRSGRGAVGRPGGRRGRGFGGAGRGGGGLRHALEPVLLLQLQRGAAHGYRLLDGLEEFELGDIDPSVVYRLLREMELSGWVKSTWDEHQTQGPPRRVYRLNREGERMLEQWARDLERSRLRIDRFLRAHKETKDGTEGQD